MPAAVFAQHTAVDDTLPAVQVQGSSASAYRSDSARSASKLDAPLRDIPQSVHVVTQALLRERGVRSMEDALKHIPGISLSHGDGQRDQVFIRGFDALGDQFVDGLRDDAMYFRDLSNVEQIDVIKGPAAVLYGRGSAGGLINRISKKPGIDKTEASLQTGSWQQRRGEWDVARMANPDAAWRITGAVERANSFRRQQFLQREALAPSVQWSAGPQTQLLLQAEYLRDRRVTDWGIPSWQGRPLDIDYATYYGAANARAADTVQSRVAAFSATLEHRFNAQWALRNALRHYRYTLDRSISSVLTVSAHAQFPSGYQATRSRRRTTRVERGLFNQSEITQEIHIGSTAHKILYGLEYGVQDRARARGNADIAPVDAYQPILEAAVPIAVGAPLKGASSVLAVYAQDLITLTPQWKLLTGIRQDTFRQTIDSTTIPNRTDKAWSPRLGLVFRPTARQSWYGSVSRAFQPAGENFHLTAANATTAPQETTNMEVGSKIDVWENRAQFSAALFHLKQINIMTADPANPLVAAVPLGIKKTRGLEWSLTGDLPGGWQFSGGSAWLDVHMTQSRNPAWHGKRATLTPRRSASLWLHKALPGGWAGALGSQYVGARFADPSTQQPPTKVGGLILRTESPDTRRLNDAS